MNKLAKTFVLIIAAAFLMTGNAMAFSLGTSDDPSEPSLQEIFDDVIGNGTINAETDYVPSSDPYQGMWETSEANVDAYRVSMYRGDSGVLGIYSIATGEKHDLMTTGLEAHADFGINDAGHLYVNDMLVDDNFGEWFGFYWRNTDSGLMSYTQDSENAAGTGYSDTHENMLALTYLVEDGLTVKTEHMGETTVTAKGNDDWILAFEDVAKCAGGDGDFNDAVFYVEDMRATPEPATILLLGSGLAGLAGFRRKKFSRKTKQG